MTLISDTLWFWLFKKKNLDVISLSSSDMFFNQMFSCRPYSVYIYLFFTGGSFLSLKRLTCPIPGTNTSRSKSDATDRLAHAFISSNNFCCCCCMKRLNLNLLNLSGDPTRHRRSALCPVPIGWKCGHPPGGSPCSSQASDAIRTAASGSTATARTGKVSQSPSSSRFLFFFSCGDHGATCCRTMETAAAFSRWLAIPWLALLVFWLLLFFQPGVFHQSDASLCVFRWRLKKIKRQEVKFLSRVILGNSSSHKGEEKFSLILNFKWNLWILAFLFKFILSKVKQQHNLYNFSFDS